MPLEQAIPDFELLRSEVAAQADEQLASVHGEKHWRAVAAVGLRLLDETPQADPLVVLLFALLHDSRRINDYDDPEHGIRAAHYARSLQLQRFVLQAEQLALLDFACHHHAFGDLSSDPTIGVCWDSDRLNLWRVGLKPSERLLSTAAAKKQRTILWARTIASQPPTWFELVASYAKLLGSEL